jgi:hypothetical protein
VVADLWGDLLGAEADLNGRPEGLRYGDAPEGLRHGGTSHGLSEEDVRWLSPLPLWTGILAGPVAWALDLSISYAIVKWTCSSQRQAVLHLITPAALLIVAIGVYASIMALRHTAADEPTDGPDPRQRARFMAMLGLTMGALFGLTVMAGAIPRWVLDACQ